MRLRSPLALPPIALALLLPLLTDASSALSAPGAPAFRRTDATPDAMVDDALARATAPGSTERAQAASMVVIAALADRAANGHAEQALARLAASPGVTADVRDQAALMARMAGSNQGTEAGERANHALGVVQALSILGPFRDTGGGLDAHDGPETGQPTFAESGRYAWGSYDVAWREVPRAFAQATGVPLDVFVFPRKESCTWLASALEVAKPQALVLRAASTGQIRLVLDGVDVARDDSVAASLRLDRLAVRADVGAGRHLLAAKVCTGALDDDGQVRLRVTDDAGHWPEGVTEAPWSDALRPGKHAATHASSTLLARSIGKLEGDTDARLDVAVLRTLGGADDLRSPRAPGLLASLADAGLNPDGFATAGWIAPIGSNRSGWLLRARAEGDAGTREFAARRLVERHAQAGMVDWAMATLRGARLEEAKDAEAAILTATVESALGTDALRVRALHRLESSARAEGERAPDALLDLLARTAEGLAPEVAVATREQLAKRGDLGAARVKVLASTRGLAAAVPAAQRAFAGGVTDASDALAVAQAVARTGAHVEARALYETLARWAPNRAPVWAGLAEELSAAPSDATASAVIAASLRRARELEPADARYRAELELRTKPSSKEAETHEDERYLVPSETILARRVGVTRSPGSEAPDVSERDLYWLRAVVMHADRRVSEMVQYAHEIVIAPRTEDELYEDIRSEGDQTEILRARVHRKDGTEAFPVEESNEHASPRIRWPDLAPGDVVEVAFRSWTAGPVGGRGDPPFYRLDYAGALTTHPLLYNEDVIESPPDHPIYAGVVNGKADHVEERDENGRHIVRWVWDHPPAIADEPLSPPMSETVPVLVMSTFKDWNAFRAWYADAVHGFTEPDAQVRELAAKLTRGKGTREEKLRALFDFVADDIRYVNYVSGEWWLPNRPQQLLARREGDCDDKALLLITLLKAVGIEAQEVMVQTRLTNEPSIVRAKAASIPLFDHGIAFLPGPNGGTYLDATSPQSRLGPLPSMDARAPALRMDGPAEMVSLPSSSPDDHGEDSTWTVRLAPSGSAELEGEERAIGDEAFWMRTNLTEPDARAQWVEDHLVGPWFATVEVDRKVEFHGDLGRGAADVKWKAHSDGLARHEGPELVVPLSPSQPMASQLAPLVRRTVPVWLPSSMAPRKESRTIRVVAPKGWRFESLPQGGDENGGAFGHAHLEVTRDPRDPQAVLVKRSMTFDQSVVPVDEYPRWRAWIQRSDALMHKALRLETTGGAR